MTKQEKLLSIVNNAIEIVDIKLDENVAADFFDKDPNEFPALLSKQSSLTAVKLLLENPDWSYDILEDTFLQIMGLQA